MENYGVLSLLPVAVVIVLVFLTKRTTVSLLAGTLVGAVMLYGVHFAKPWLEVVYGVMGSELWIWLVLVCGPSSLWAQQCGGPRTGFTFPGKCWPFSAMPRRLLSV